MLEADAVSMWDTCAVELRLELPKGAAAELEEAQRKDPEGLSRILLYALTRRVVFDHLMARTGDLPVR
jgi:hypothetical protein